MSIVYLAVVYLAASTHGIWSTLGMGAFPSLLAFSNLLSNSPRPASLPPCPPPLALGAPFILLGPYLTEMSVLLALPLPLESWPALRAVERGGGRGEEEEGGGETRPSAHSRVKSESLCRVEIFLPPEASCFSLALRSCSRSDSCELNLLFLSIVCLCLPFCVCCSFYVPAPFRFSRCACSVAAHKIAAKMNWQKWSYLTINTYLTTIVHP